MAQPKKKPVTKVAKSTKRTSTKAAPKAVKHSKKTTSSEYQTLRLSKADRPFLSTTLTNQTFYWLIIAVIVLALGGWIVHLQIKINEVYDAIDANQIYYEQMEDLEQRIEANKKAIEGQRQTEQKQQ